MPTHKKGQLWITNTLQAFMSSQKKKKTQIQPLQAFMPKIRETFRGFHACMGNIKKLIQGGEGEEIQYVADNNAYYPK